MILRGLVVGVCLWLIAAPALAAFGKNEVRELEGLLADLGFDPGPVDGVLDEQTRTAIKSRATRTSPRCRSPDGLAGACSPSCEKSPSSWSMFAFRKGHRRL